MVVEPWSERHHCHLCNMEPSMRAEDFQISSFLADLNAPLANSTLLANPLQIDLKPSAADPTDTIRIVRGRICSTVASVTSRMESPQR